MAFTATAAVVTGEAVVTAATVFAAAAEIGTAMAVVGAVTGNKDLTKLGAAIGIVGGIGSLTTSALADEAAQSVLTQEAVDDGTTQGIADAMGGDTATQTLTSSASPTVAPIEGAVSDAANTALGNPASQLNPNASPASNTGANAVTGLPDTQTATSTDITPSGASPQIDGVNAPNAPATPYDVNSPALDDGSTPSVIGAGAQTKAQAAAGGGSDFWDKLSGFAGKNSNGLLMIGGMALKGASETSIANQKTAIDQQKVAIDQQKLNQTQYGNSLPTLRAGILTRA
jgi:hypothetical protein